MLREMSDEEFKDTKELIFLVFLALILVGTAAAGYKDDGIKGMFLYLLAVFGLPVVAVFVLAWLWRGICVACDLTPADIDEITKGGDVSDFPRQMKKRLPGCQAAGLNIAGRNPKSRRTE